YNPDGDWTSQHQMSINGKFKDITRTDLMEFATKNNIKEASEIIDHICGTAARWERIAAECGVPADMIKGIQSEFKLSL
ncbi:MAG: hypothetical protein NC324_05735, partial [Bacteroides sp.]|nr:hypothetical protein [Bacteroides sp.]